MFQTTRQTLLSVPGTIFDEAFQGDIEELKSPIDGSIFVDRSGELFKYILERLRGNTLAVTNDSLRTQVEQEAAFYKMGVPDSNQTLTWDVQKSHEATILNEEKRIEKGLVLSKEEIRRDLDKLTISLNAGYREVSKREELWGKFIKVGLQANAKN